MKPFKCEICGDTYKSRSGFWQHKNNHSNKEFPCKFCKRTFKNKTYLRTHTLVHTGEKPHGCDLCDKSFTQRSNLNRHRLTHQNAGELLKCLCCNACFQTQNDLYAHLQTHMSSSNEGGHCEDGDSGRKDQQALSTMSGAPKEGVKNSPTGRNKYSTPSTIRKQKNEEVKAIDKSGETGVVTRQGFNSRHGKPGHKLVASLSKQRNEVEIDVKSGRLRNSREDNSNVGMKKRTRHKTDASCKEIPESEIDGSQGNLGTIKRTINLRTDSKIDSKKKGCKDSSSNVLITSLSNSKEELQSVGNSSEKVKEASIPTTPRHSPTNMTNEKVGNKNIPIVDCQETNQLYRAGTKISILPVTNNKKKVHIGTIHGVDKTTQLGGQIEEMVVVESPRGIVESGPVKKIIEEPAEKRICTEANGHKLLNEINTIESSPSGEITEVANLLLNISKNVNFTTDMISNSVDIENAAISDEVNVPTDETVVQVTQKINTKDNMEGAPRGKKCFMCDICGKQFRLLSVLNSHIDKHIRPIKCKECSKKFASERLLSSHVTAMHTSEMPYKCRECSKAFKTYNLLYSHRRIHSVEAPIICELCGKKFRSRVHFQSHTRTHEDKKMFKCDKCDRTFNHRSGVRIHQLTHIKLVSATKRVGKLVQNITVKKEPKTSNFCHKCDICGKIFRFPSKLRIHMATHTKEKLGGKCVICEKSFSTPGSFKKHMELHDGILYQCEVCTKTYSQRSNLMRHMHSHYGRKPFQCEICKRMYDTEDELSIHSLSHNGGKPYQCAVCDKTFSYLNIFKKHFMIHNNDRPFKCEFCPKAFVDKHALKYHRMTHTGECPHKCDICGKGFIQKSNYNRHLQTHYLLEPAKKYKCKTCGRCFHSKVYFQDHQSVHTGEINYKCQICEKGFRYRSGLRMHLRRHAGHYAHSCEVCGKGFFKKVDLQTHSSIHTGIKPFQCGSCHLSFKTKNGLKLHMLKHAKNPIDIDNMNELDFSDGNKQHESRLTFLDRQTGKEHVVLPLRVKPAKPDLVDTEISNSVPESAITTPDIGEKQLKEGNILRLEAPVEPLITQQMEAPSIVDSSNNPQFDHEYEIIFDMDESAQDDENVIITKKSTDLQENFVPTMQHTIIQVETMKNKAAEFTNVSTIDDTQVLEKVDDYMPDIVHYAVENNPEVPSIGEGTEEVVSTVLVDSENASSTSYEQIQMVESEQPEEVKYLLIPGENDEETQLISLSETGTDDAVELVKLLLNDGEMIVNYTLGEEDDQQASEDVQEEENEHPQIIYDTRTATEILLQLENKIPEGSELTPEGEASTVSEINSNIDIVLDSDCVQPRKDRPQKFKARPEKSKRQKRTRLRGIQKKPKYIPSVGRFKCNVCGALFRYMSKLKVHTSSHSDEKSFLCNECGKTFSAKASLQVHLRSHQGAQFVCKICLRAFTQKSNLRRHQQLKHFGPNPFKCDICNRTFTSEEDLNKHALGHTAEKPHVCDICSKSFSFPGRLLIHRRMHTNYRPYTCTVCDKSFAGEHMLRSHMLVHSENRRYSCDTCGKGFNQKNNLSRHQLTHTGVKPFKCGVCLKHFSSKVCLNNHIVIHGTEAVYKCEVCEKVFFKLSSLQTHHSLHTGNQPLKCETCGKGFTHLGNLNRHRLIHKGVKLFRCAVCGKQLSSKVNLNKHMSLHEKASQKSANIKSWSCDKCEESFSAQSALVEHMLTHEVDEPVKLTVQNNSNDDKSASNLLTDIDCNISVSTDAKLKPNVSNPSRVSGGNTIYAKNTRNNQDSLLHFETHKDSKSGVDIEKLPHVCDTCGKTFNRITNLKRHQAVHAENAAFKCDVCNKSLSSKATLEKHLITHSELKHSCRTCGKEFSSRAAYRTHLLTHSGKNLKTCEKCGKQFNHVGNYKKHLWMHSAVKPFQCKICKRHLSSKINLLSHMTRHSEEEKHEIGYAEECPFKCKTCGKAFPTSMDRRHHMYQHMDNYPFECPVCQKKFKLKANMTRHQKTHTTKESLRCEVCHMILLNKRSLDQHVKRCR